MHVKPEHELLTWSLQQYCYTWVYVHILECLYLPIDSGQFGVYPQVGGTRIRVKSILLQMKMFFQWYIPPTTLPRHRLM